MRVLLLVHAFNGLSQRLWAELTARGYTVSVEFDVHDELTREGVALFEPDLILAPYLRRPIPDDIWQRIPCLILHPGPLGDRGPAALDWACLEQPEQWGITVLQATADLDAGPVWSYASFPMRAATKSSLYRREVTEFGVSGMLEALDRWQNGKGPMLEANHGEQTGWRGSIPRELRKVDWRHETSAEILRKFRASDSWPGVLDGIDGRRYRLFDAHPVSLAAPAEPGAWLGTHDGYVCRATADGAIWFGQAMPATDGAYKRPAASLFAEHAGENAQCEAPTVLSSHRVGQIRYIDFPFYNGAMSTRRCEQLLAGFRDACADTDVRIIVLRGGREFWSNGMDLNVIEAASNPADESMRNIEAMNDLVREILTTRDKLTVAALQGNAAAGGCFFALAADLLVAREGVVLNPHYKSMGNLYGSEYWTYQLPRRVGKKIADRIIQNRLPMSAQQGRDLGLIDHLIGASDAHFDTEVERWLADYLEPDAFAEKIEAKQTRLDHDEKRKPLENYRREELERMRENFYGFDPSYHVARYRFVSRQAHGRTPLYLALHRRIDWTSSET